ncbi:MAG: hypothetical protein FD129_1180 [bacterium]|nr:MAG: hypothetical protein FD129_1180 [bacterium]
MTLFRPLLSARIGRSGFVRTLAAPVAALALVLGLAATVPSIGPGVALAGYADPPAIPKTPEEVTALVRTQLARAQSSLDQILAVSGKRTIENTLVPYNELSIALAMTP